jgi:hypothetical protein
MNNIKYFAITENFQYMFTDKGICKISFDLNDLKNQNILPYTFENLDVAIDILKENLAFKYQIGKINLLEYTSSSRKFMYKIIEVFQPKNEFSIINEWERKFGKDMFILTENTDKYIVEKKINNSFDYLKEVLNEQWWNPASKDFVVYKGAQNLGKVAYNTVKGAGNWLADQGRQIGEKGVLGYIGDKATKLYNYVSSGIASAWKGVKSGFTCIMEGIKSLLFSVGGMVLSTGLSLIPVVGNVANAVLYGALLIWEIYKMMSGKYEQGPYQWSSMDIIFAMLSMIPFMAPLVKTARTALVGVKTFAQLGKLAAKGGIAGQIVKGLSKGINTVVGLVGQASKFIGEKLGIKWLANWGTKTADKLKSIVDDMAGAAGTAGGTTKTLSSISQNAKQNLQKIWGKDIALAKIPTTKKVVKTIGGTIAISAGMCGVLGLTLSECGKRAESGEINNKQLTQAEKDFEALKNSWDDIDKQQALANAELEGDF